MRHLRWLAAPVLALAFSFLTPSAPASAGGALLINDTGCALYAGDGSIVVTLDSHAVVTPSGNGMLKCKAEVKAAASGQAVHFDSASTHGVMCVTPAGVTADWRETVSADGQATLTCHVH